MSGAGTGRCSYCIFRLAEPKDAEQIAQLRCANPNERWTRDVERAVRSDLAEAVADGDPEYCVHVAVDTRTAVIVGVVAHGSVSWEDPDGDSAERSSYIHALAVVHEHRRRGIGERLKLDVLNEAAEAGMKLVTSNVHRKNFAMKALNDKLGVASDRDPQDGEMYFTVAGIAEADEPSDSECC